MTKNSSEILNCSKLTPRKQTESVELGSVIGSYTAATRHG